MGPSFVPLSITLILPYSFILFFLNPSPIPSLISLFLLISSTCKTIKHYTFTFLFNQNKHTHKALMSAAITTTAATTAAYNNCYIQSNSHVSPPPPLSRYESQKRRDWNTFGQYLKNHRPPLNLSRCSGAHVLEFLRYLDQFGKTKVHTNNCPFFGHPHPPAPCPCPLKQAWGSLDALIGRLRAAFEEHGGSPETNPFGARAVRLYLREVRDSQAKARGIAYDKKKRKKPEPQKVSRVNHHQEHDDQYNCPNNNNNNINITHDLFAQDQRLNVQVSENRFEGLGMVVGHLSDPRSSMIHHMSFFN